MDPLRTKGKGQKANDHDILIQDYLIFAFCLLSFVFLPFALCLLPFVDPGHFDWGNI